MTADEIFKEGIELRNRGELNEAIERFHSVLELFPRQPQRAGIYAVLAGVYHDKGDHDNAKKYFTFSLEINPNYELASLGLYVSLVKLGEDENAILEMQRFLEQNQADLYKITLQELMDGLRDGFMTTHEVLITTLAEKNGIF